jgi:hypothetical protein
MRGLAACVVIFGVVLAGCSKTGERQAKAAVQAAVEAHLQQRQNLMLTNMTLEVQDVNFTGDTAQADVKFRSKQSPNIVVSVRYTLRRARDRWQVESSSPSSGMDASPHRGPTAPSSAPAPAQTPLQPSH